MNRHQRRAEAKTEHPAAAPLRIALAEILSGVKTPDDLRAMVQELFDEIQPHIDNDARVNKAACRQGCNWCCAQVPEATPAEILHIALSGGEYVKGPKPWCGFLHDGACSIYDVRPLLCRGAFSPQAETCEARHKRGHRKSGISSMFALAIEAEKTLGRAIKLTRLEGGHVPVDIGMAAIKEFDSPQEATKQWLRGERIFRRFTEKRLG